ncbi:SDR family NAD(P)-dependent oxidoreductase [Mucilaginibacter rubeus]|uniref:SDR family NAD(P)-dependent oxidoreductase n=1 Tax=Mucilaginibacter rubeus TaxID=2027860 RepID=A0AAE6JE71_9SPHI|nr:MULTISPECIES: oxidoreductase [Mucilaginibacter]QEM04064.1 SDR family NAD(P)-dependent oxidoreductase [Mucilaginibacter rubeus]QEM16667.1 SDR family NAD(P)-dependent oxidoreductase [Mucilaginibacter gossypii]QTE46859.1 SDR family NAD(P)-dependent oxidoreductase [Mucilaginibacter rubeus]QTE53457.1 SDR family NAD(P)-dependent oxidoreductase [Mucilaginibacter rubeus]QTE58543.1 SDR family NAD(P)-dependent oxidoreductase [Mucilaginibacter rubeus]
MKQKIWLITGASKGLGLEIVKTVLAAGDKVIATVRNDATGLKVALGNPTDLFVVSLDVTKEAEVKQGVSEALKQFGQIDVLVNNAGFGIVGAIEEASDEEVRRQYDTNVFGVLNLVRALLPSMRERKSGHIINISSLFGYGALAGWALYGSTKYAVEGLSEGLALELAPFNIKVTALAPGLFRTQFLNAQSYSLTKESISDYQTTTVGQMKAVPEALHGNQPGDPAKLARVVLELANTENPPLHLPVGKDSLQTYRSNRDKVSQEIEAWAGKFTPTELTA